MEENQNEKIICAKCNVELQPTKINLHYLDNRMSHEFLSCPVCHQVYIPEEMAHGRMHEIERMLEDK